jgi:uncharacterized protein YeaO (DUF488 family)
MASDRRSGRLARAPGPGSWSGLRLHTIGHSTRSQDELISLLRTFGVSALADIRTIPRSRRNPQFDTAALRAALRPRSIRYMHLPELGGLRRPRADSRNTGWRNAGFRGFADHMETETFERGLGRLRALAARAPVALMCAEAVPWRCHRSLVADALAARGAQVEHILGPTRAEPHALTPFAVVEGARVRYPDPSARKAPPARRPAGRTATRRVDVRIRRAYDPPARGDGHRVLVDRVWPRGVAKADLALDAWSKEVAPSTALRRWFGHDAERWPAFQERYFAELDALPDAVHELVERARRGRLTLVYGARDPDHNQAVALRAYLRARAAGRRPKAGSA